MITSKLSTVALALSVAAAIASPALAASKHHHTSQHAHPGYAARAQSMDPDMSEGMTAHRAEALRECNDVSGKLLQKDWGVRQSEMYGACMMQHGERE